MKLGTRRTAEAATKNVRSSGHRYMFHFPVTCITHAVECCFTSTETVGLLGTGAQDVHLDFHRAPELWSHMRLAIAINLEGKPWLSADLRPQKP